MIIPKIQTQTAGSNVSLNYRVNAFTKSTLTMTLSATGQMRSRCLHSVYVLKAM